MKCVNLLKNGVCLIYGKIETKRCKKCLSLRFEKSAYSVTQRLKQSATNAYSSGKSTYGCCGKRDG